MALGHACHQLDPDDPVVTFCRDALAERSIYAFLHRERDHLFPDAMFSDLFVRGGRPSVPPSVVATVMVLQRLEGLSDREAVDRFRFDVRWRYAAGVGGWDGGGPVGFVHTVLVDMRERLRRSSRPDRVFQAGLEAARAVGLVGRKRVLDSTALYDAVATMDTVTLIRSAMRGLLRATSQADAELAGRLRACCASGDDYASTAKPHIDWEDKAERDALVDSRARDAHAVLAALHGLRLAQPVAQAAALLAAVTGQDLDQDAGGTFRLARRVAADRMVSTVDPQARHGHKSAARGFDGYKGHVAVDPDAELVTATAATPANHGDAEVAEELLADVLPPAATAATHTATVAGQVPHSPPGQDGPTEATTTAGPGTAAEPVPTRPGEGDERVAVYGDTAYGTGPLLNRLENADAEVGTKVQPPSVPKGHFSKDRFDVDLQRDTVTCPSGVTVGFGRPNQRGQRTAEFGVACADCALATRCTTAAEGRTITVGPYEAQLARARTRQTDPAWQAGYRANRPKVERKIAHLMRHRHGGRRARVRGLQRVAQDFNRLAAAVNLARLAALQVTSTAQGWQLASA